MTETRVDHIAEAKRLLQLANSESVSRYNEEPQ